MPESTHNRHAKLRVGGCYRVGRVYERCKPLGINEALGSSPAVV
jgi:hypothetical protein